MLHPYMAYAKGYRHECAVLVIAESSRKAKTLAWRYGWELGTDTFTDLRVQRIREDADFFMAFHGGKSEPDVYLSPPTCKRCEQWGRRIVDGLCVPCHEDAEADAAFAAYDALVAERDAVARERDSLRTALMASPDEMTVEFCKLVDCVKEEMADKRELLHRLNTDPDTTKALLLKSDQLLAAAERERDALRGVVEKARQLDAVVYGNRPGGAGSFDERHRAQVEFIDALRALDENNKS